MALVAAQSYNLPEEIREGTLLYLLSNELILRHTVPYLPISAVLDLAATSRAFRSLIYTTPGVFRYLDLTRVQRAQFEIPPIDHGGETWRNVQLDENLTEDDFYSGPLRGVFNSLARSHLLKQVQTLVLDGLAVTAELVHDILTDPSYNVRILSLRDAKHLNEGLLRRALQTACRPSRPAGTPKLKGLYIFGPREPPAAALMSGLGTGGNGGNGGNGGSRTSAVGASWNARSQAVLSEMVMHEGDAWYARRGKILSRPISPDWAGTLVACRGVLAFDAVLCRGPRHYNSPAFGRVAVSPGGSQFAVATHTVRGCEGCGAAPEGWTSWADVDHVPEDDGGDVGRFPLLAPPPLFSSTARAAMCPTGQDFHPSRHTSSSRNDKGNAPRFIARCMECLRDRYCWSCHRWWCESCFQGSAAAANAVAMAAQSGVNGAPTESVKTGVARSCWECGNNCHDCISTTQLMCRSCCGGYCIIHNEGSTLTTCDWCSGRGRRTRELY